MAAENIINSGKPTILYPLTREEIDQMLEEASERALAKRDAKERTKQDAPVGVDEICRLFKLAKNNVKSHKWRVMHGFPTCQTSRGARVQFIPSQVREWQLRQGEKVK